MAKPIPAISVCFSFQVDLRDTSSFTFLLYNIGRFSMCVTFELEGPPELLQHLEAKPGQEAVVEVSQQLNATLCFRPQRKCSLQGVRLHAKVRPALADECGPAMSTSGAYYKPHRHLNLWTSMYTHTYMSAGSRSDPTNRLMWCSQILCSLGKTLLINLYSLAM